MRLYKLEKKQKTREKARTVPVLGNMKSFRDHVKT
jgi:hypothetical protein